MYGSAIVVTHHKTGSVWMGTTFRKIGQALNIPVMDLVEITRPEDIRPPVIILHPHWRTIKQTPKWLLEGGSYRIAHIVRDPRDVIISGMHYHRTATEPWLHRKHPGYGNLTYQEKINSLPSDEDRYIFEMDHSSGRTIRTMSRWNYGLKNSFECKYENLIEDTEMLLFTKMLRHFSFSEEEMDACREIIWVNALFGGKGRHKPRTAHIRSGQARQWEDVFNRKLSEAFVEKFGNALIVMGYEKDNNWVSRVRSGNATAV